MALLRKDEYESRKHDLELERAELRTQFVEEQQELPIFRTMNGLEYKRRDDVLTRDLEDLERSWQVTRYMASQRKGKGSSKTPAFNTTNWKPVGEGQYRLAMARGDMTRTTGEGQNRKFEVGE